MFLLQIEVELWRGFKLDFADGEALNMLEVLKLLGNINFPVGFNVHLGMVSLGEHEVGFEAVYILESLVGNLWVIPGYGQFVPALCGLFVVKAVEAEIVLVVVVGQALGVDFVEAVEAGSALVRGSLGAGGAAVCALGAARVARLARPASLTESAAVVLHEEAVHALGALVMLAALRAVVRLSAVHALLAPLRVLAFVPAAEALAHAVLRRGCRHRLGGVLYQVQKPALLAPASVAHPAVLAVHALAVQTGRAQAVAHVRRELELYIRNPRTKTFHHLLQHQFARALNESYHVRQLCLVVRVDHVHMVVHVWE